MNLSISSLLVSHKENTSSIYCFHSSDFVLLWLKIAVSTADMKILAKASAIFVPIAVKKTFLHQNEIPHRTINIAATDETR